jgi:tRNA dimethylallyltransferase
MSLAERHGAMIISADSRQVYRAFDIGTAKPSRDERARIRHEGLDVADPARFADAARRWSADAASRRQPVLVVGGTGLWLSALVRPLAEEPPLDASRRTALQAELAVLDTPTLRRWVDRLDPPRAAGGRTQLLRAIEVALLSGTRISDWHARGSRTPALRARWLIADPGEALPARIEARLDAMLSAGWADEVRGLLATVDPDAPAWNATGYREIRAMVEGRTTLVAAR